MRFKTTLWALFLGLFIFVLTANAQTVDVSKLKSSQFSDAQLIELYKTRIEGSGYTIDQGVAALVQRGMDPAEAQVFKKRLEDLQNSGKLSSKPNPVTSKDTNTPTTRDSNRITEPKPVRRPSKIYGAELFSNAAIKFEPNVRIATPPGYILGPDDELTVSFTGLNERVTTAKISPDGYLRLPSIGLVYLNGLSITDATRKIRAQALKVYPALNSGATNLNVSLGNVRSIRVHIVGEVLTQGSYTVSSLSTLFNALYQSGGPTRNGSLRNIEVIRGGSVYRTVDLYSFIQSGTLRNNVRLEDQDFIRVPQYTKRVAIDGEVRMPGLYELKADETITDLLKYAGGFSDLAFRGIAKVSQIGERERSVKDVPSDLFDRYVLKNADSLFFGAILERYSNRVNIEGAVYREGPFELTKDLTLKGIIQKAEGLRPDAYLENGFIRRTNPNMDKEQISFNLSRIYSGAQADIPLMREDTVVIISRQSLKDNLTVTIDGNVRSPGTFEYRAGMTVADLVAMANGFNNVAATHRVEISRLVNDKSDTVSNALIIPITLNLDSATIGQQGQFKLQPLDFISIPRLVNNRSLGVVKIRGEVLSPGDYPLLRRNETGIEFISRAGGVTPIGSLENAQVFRNGTRVDVNLTNNSLKKNRNMTIFMEGDSVFVPRKMPYVEVAGAVNTPQLLSFVSSNFQYYINAAGGLTEDARIKSAFVQYPNGTNQPVKKFLFFRNYPQIVAGSKIVVPENKGIKVKLGVGEISAIASALTALVTVIAILVK